MASMQKISGPMVARKGFTNGNEEGSRRERKSHKAGKEFSLHGMHKIIVAVLGAGLMIAGSIVTGGIPGTPNLVEPEAVDWQQEYWDNVFFHLNNTTENQNFVSDFLTVYNASDWEHYNATRDLVLKGGINPMWLARYIAGNMWSREEFDILPDVFNVNSSLENHGNLSLIFTEVDNLQKDNGGINASEAQMINIIFDSYLYLSSLEQKSLFLTPMNKTNEPPITTAGKSQNELLVTSSDIKALDTAKPMDTGDLMWWLWTNFSAQKGIDINNVTQEKILWAYLSIFDGFLDNNRDWQDSEVLNYMSQQFDEFGLNNLTAIANFSNSLIWLQQKIWPQTLFTKYASSGSDKFDSGVFWINHLWNNTLVDAYKQARQFWQNHSLDSEVVGKNGSTALSDLEGWINLNLNAGGGNPPPLGNFTLFYENFFSKFLQGYKVDMDCESISTTATFLIHAQNHLYLNNNVVTNISGASKIPLTAFQVQMYDSGGTGHTDVGYVGYNNTLYNVTLTLSDGGWGVFSSNESKPDYQVQIPPAFIYELESPYGAGDHTGYGFVDVNIRGDDIWLPYYNHTAIPANETNQETNYSKAVSYVEKAREGTIKFDFGYGNAPYSRGVYDLLNKDNVAIPEFQDILIPTFAAIAMTVGMYRAYGRDLRRKRN